MEDTDKNNYIEDFRIFSEKINLLLLLDITGRNGSLFFSTIFDKHDEILCCPFFQYFFSTFEEIFQSQPIISSSDFYNIWLTSRYTSIFNANSKKESSRLLSLHGSQVHTFDIILFQSLVKQITAQYKFLSRKNTFLICYFAFSVTNRVDITNVKYILLMDQLSLKRENLFQSYSGVIIKNAREDYPDCKIIALIRDPRASVTSLTKEYVEKYGNPYTYKLSNMLKTIKDGLKINYTWGKPFVLGFWILYHIQVYSVFELLLKDYKDIIVLKNEDINANLSKTMRSLVAHLNIKYFEPWSSNNFQPTYLGAPWLGVSKVGNRLEYSRPNISLNNRWMNTLNKSTIIILEYILQKYIKKWNYKFVYPKSTFHRYKFLYYFILPLHMDNYFSFKCYSRSKVLTYLEKYILIICFPLFYIILRLSFLLALKKIR